MALLVTSKSVMHFLCSFISLSFCSINVISSLIVLLKIPVIRFCAILATFHQIWVIGLFFFEKFAICSFVSLSKTFIYRQLGYFLSKKSVNLTRLSTYLYFTKSVSPILTITHRLIVFFLLCGFSWGKEFVFNNDFKNFCSCRFFTLPEKIRIQSKYRRTL